MKIISTKYRPYFGLLIPFIASVITIVVPPIVYPHAGKRMENKHAEFSFQLDHWNNEVYKEINTIIESGNYARIARRASGDTEIKTNYCADLAMFDYQLQQLTRTIGYQVHIVVNILSELAPLEERIKTALEAKKRTEVDIHIKNFQEVMEVPKKKELELVSLVKQMGNKCELKKPNMSAEESAAKLIELTNFLRQIYMNLNSPLRVGNDPFQDIEKFGNATSSIFSDYDLVVQKINEQAEVAETRRNGLIMFLALLSIFITVREALKVQAKKEIENSREI